MKRCIWKYSGKCEIFWHSMRFFGTLIWIYRSKSLATTLLACFAIINRGFWSNFEKEMFKFSSVRHFFGEKKLLHNFKSIWFDKVPLHFKPLSFREFIWKSHLSIETRRKHKILAKQMTDRSAIELDAYFPLQFSSWFIFRIFLRFFTIEFATIILNNCIS